MQSSTSTNLVQDDTSPAGGGWTPEERKQLEAVRAFTPEQRAEALAATRAKFTDEDLAEIGPRSRKHQELIERLAATETLEEQQQLADELCPEFDDWIRGRNRVRFAARRPRTVAAIVPRGARTQAAPRERRDSSSSRTSGTDPGDDDPDDEGPGDGFELVLVDEETPATQTSPRYCRCESNWPHTAPNWQIGPDGGDCRTCTRELRPRDVRYWHARARSERARLLAKGWEL